MSTEPTPEPTDGDDGTTPPATALAPDRPVVDGTAKTAAEIRAELEELLAEDERRAAREPAGPAAVDGTERVRPRPVPAVPHRARAEPVDVDQGRTGPAVRAAAVTVRETAQQRPDLLAAVAVAIVVILLIARRLRRD